jgi:hypothetical protein
MANASKSTNQKKLEYKRVSYDVNEIAPDAPAGEWLVSIPRGKCKVQPTKEDRYPMLIVPFRIEKCADEDDEVLARAIGTELSTMIVFFGEEANARAIRLSKIRLRQLCEAADVDLDLVPKEIDDPDNDLEPLIRALEGKKFPAWTVLTTRKDTGEVTTEMRFQDPKGTLKRAEDDEDEDEEDADESKRSRRSNSKKKSSSRSNNRTRH